MASKTLKQANQLINHGETEEAKMLLLQYVRQDSSNEEAWLKLASLLSGKHRIDCLEWALKINPQNEQTRQRLLKLNPQGGYTEADWQKQDYVLSGIPMLDERNHSSGYADLSKDEMIFKPDRTMTFQKSLGISFSFFCAFLYLRWKLHLHVPFLVYLLVNIAVFLVFFVFIYLCLSLHFRIITVTRTQLIIERPKFRLFRKRRIIRIEDVLVKEALEIKLANKELKIRNSEPVSIAFLSEKQMVILAGIISHLQKHP